MEDPAMIMLMKSPLFWIGMIAIGFIHYRFNKSIPHLIIGIATVGTVLMIVVGINSFIYSYEQPSSHTSTYNKPRVTLDTPASELHILDY